MDKIIEKSTRKLQNTSLGYRRDELNKWPWDTQLLGIQGSRGVGKTTLFLQHMAASNLEAHEMLYISLDDIYFIDNRLVDVADQFRRLGGKRLYIDEVHKYPNWSVEIKNIYDDHPDLKIAFTGSSMMELRKGNADLSRRALIRHMQGLSFRQFMNLSYVHDGHPEHFIRQYSLDDILSSSNDIIQEINAEIKDFKPYVHLAAYLRHGYYPFFLEGISYFPEKLEATVMAVLEVDFAQTYNVSATNIRSIYKLLYAISTSPPFQPNIERLSKRIGLSRKTLLEYIHYLANADILSILKNPKKGISILKKPDKIYLENTNLLYTFEPHALQIGMVRETYVMNQLKESHDIHFSQQGDVLVDEKYTFEVGGKKKNNKQIYDIDDAYILADDIDYRVGNKIPMWMIGLMY